MMARYPSSVTKLQQLKYDPIESLLMTRAKLEKEILYQEQVRDRKIIPLGANGKERGYYADTHMMLFAQMSRIDEALIRYGYARVPETVNINEERTAPLVINLTPKGQPYIINRETEE
jgi:hypothetical protein